MKFDPHHYQKVAIEFIMEHRSCALILDLGLGKTVTAATAISDQFDHDMVRKVLIIGPKRVVQHTWPSEFEQWDHLNLTYQVIQGNPKQREKLLAGDEQVHMINFENLTWLVNHLGKNWNYDLVLFDESSRMKSPGAKRFRAFRKVRRYVNNVILLTGTPASQSLLDLWSQIWLIDMGVRLGRTYTAFRDRWFATDQWGHTWYPKLGSDDEIQMRISDIAISMSAKDYLQLPDRVDVIDRVTLSRNQMRGYKKLEQELYLNLTDGEVTAVNAAVLAGKCLQYTSGALYHDEKDSWEEVHREKINALDEIIQSADGPVLVAYNFRSDLERLKTAFPEGRTIDSDEVIDEWNRGEVPLLLVHPASAGHGLNLQHGGHRIVWFSLTWSLELYLQLNGRLHRQGQLKPVTVHHLVAEKTVDTLVLNALRNKRSVQDSLIESIRSTK